MATTTKKATTKKPAKRTTKAAAAKKPVAKKAVAKKTTAKKTEKAAVVTVKAKTTKELSPIERLRSIHILSAIVYAIFAVLTVVFVNKTSTDLVLSHAARDMFANPSKVVLAPASEVLFSIQYRYLLAGLMVLAAVGSLLLGTVLRKNYERSVNYGASGLRWIVTGVTAGLTLVFVSLLAGINDVMTLKTVSGLIVATTLFGFLAERENLVSKKSEWLAYAASIFTGVIAWLPVAGSLVGTALYSTERFGWHVYALSGVVLAGFTAFAVNQYLHIKNKDKYQFTFIEQRYLRIDQITKFLVVLIVFSALAK